MVSVMKWRPLVIKWNQGPSDIKNNNNKMFKNNIGSDAMHISCCKMVKAKEVDIFFRSQKTA
jgi:hypothetical protein